MGNNKYNSKGKIEIFIHLIFLLGLTGYAVEYLRPLALSITPYAFLTAGLAAVYDPMKNNRALLLWSILTYFVAVTLEIIGTNTGIIFGNLHYGNTLGIKIMNVPYSIGFIWVMMILGANAAAFLLSKNKYIRWIIASCLVVITVYLGEYSAVKLDYRSWLGNYIPLKNYAASFIIVFTASAALSAGVKNYFHRYFLCFFIDLLVLMTVLYVLF